MSFIRLTPSDSVLSAEKIVRPAWRNDTASLNQFYLRSAEEHPGFIQVYADAPAANPLTQTQFSIGYGHISGSGSWGLTGISSSRLIYGTERSRIYGSETAGFSFGMDSPSSAYVSPDFYVIHLARSAYRETLQPGSLALTISGSARTLNLTDASGMLTTPGYAGSHRYYPLISGSGGVLASGSALLNTTKGHYGMVFPDLGTIILNAAALALPANQNGVDLQPVSSGASSSSNSATRLMAMMQGGPFTAFSEETLVSKNYFVRVPHDQCNYSTNPTAVDDTGNLLFPSMVQNPESFITTVGMYNDQNQLVAIAKVSSPLTKRFDEEKMFRIKL